MYCIYYPITCTERSLKWIHNPKSSGSSPLAAIFKIRVAPCLFYGDILVWPVPRPGELRRTGPLAWVKKLEWFYTSKKANGPTDPATTKRAFAIREASPKAGLLQRAI
jgi:hypothetical protein